MGKQSEDWSLWRAFFSITWQGLPFGNFFLPEFLSPFSPIALKQLKKQYLVLVFILVLSLATLSILLWQIKAQQLESSYLFTESIRSSDYFSRSIIFSRLRQVHALAALAFIFGLIALCLALTKK